MKVISYTESPAWPGFFLCVDKKKLRWYNIFMTSEEKLKNKKLFLMDMDGTVYIDDRLLPGAKEYIERAREKGKAVFMTNNSSRGISSYLEKMAKLGIEASEDDFLTSVDALIHYLENSYRPGAGEMKIFVCGTASFRKQLADSGFRITDVYEKDVDMAVLGFDRELTYRKLEDLSRILNEKPEITYLAANPDWVCPGEHGPVPDCGSMAQMIEHTTGRLPVFMGKPEPLMAEMALERYGYSREEALVIGDRIYTDIACGVNAGIDTAFVLSGEGTLEDIVRFGIEPTYIFNSIKEILI